MRLLVQWRVALAALVVTSFASCRAEPTVERSPRPVSGDTVTPVIVLGHPWQQKGLVLIGVRLQACGKEGAEPQTLQLEEVPYESVPHATLTYFAGEQLFGIEDVELKRDC